MPRRLIRSDLISSIGAWSKGQDFETRHFRLSMTLRCSSPGMASYRESSICCIKRRYFESSFGTPVSVLIVFITMDQPTN